MWVLDAGGRAFAPVTWRDELGLAGMAFSDETRAERQRARLLASARPAGARRRRPLQALRLDAGDHRAREEWLRAVLEAGAARVGFDLEGGRPEPAAFELTGALLAEVLGHKRGLSCL